MPPGGQKPQYLETLNQQWKSPSGLQDVPSTWLYLMLFLKQNATRIARDALEFSPEAGCHQEGTSHNHRNLNRKGGPSGLWECQ